METKNLKLFGVLFAMIFSFANLWGQEKSQAKIVYVDDIIEPSGTYYANDYSRPVRHKWKVRNESNVNAQDYYVWPYRAEYSSNHSSWTYYSGVGINFLNNSHYFSVSAWQYGYIDISFVVNPASSGYPEMTGWYRVWFKIYDNYGNALPTLSGGDLWTEFYYEKSFITVTIPSSSTVWQAGESEYIRWNDNISSNVKIELYKGSSRVRTIASSTASDGSYRWDIDSDLQPGSDYRIKITSTSNSSVYDYSDYFTIQEACQSPNAYFIVNNSNPEVGESITFTDGSSGDNITYRNIHFGDGRSSNLSGSVTHSYSSAGTYTATLTVRNSCGEEDTYSRTITVTCPSVSLSIVNNGNDHICQGETALLSIQNYDNSLNYTWKKDGQTIPNTTGNTLTVSESGIYTISATNSCGNSAISNSITITVHQQPDVQIVGLPTEIEQDADPIQLQGTPSGGIWSGDGVTGNTFDPSSAGLGQHTITYSYTNEFGCSNTDIKTITVIESQPHTTHFIPTWQQAGVNPYQPGTIYVYLAQNRGQDLQPGDEIGVFDSQNNCIGSGLVTTVLSNDNFLAVIVSSFDQDSPELGGAREGDILIFKFWDASENVELEGVIATYINGTSEEFHPLGTQEVELRIPLQDKLSMIYYDYGNGATSIENFNSDIYIYNVELPCGTSSITTSADAQEQTSTIQIEPQDAVTNFPATVYLNCIAGNGVINSYTVNYTVQSEPYLESLSLDGQIIDAFAPSTFDYTVTLAENDPIPNVSYSLPADQMDVNVSVSEAQSVPGTTKIILERGSCTVEYNIHFERELPTTTLEIIFDTIQGKTGSILDLAVTTRGFVNVATMQGTIVAYDSSIAKPVSVTNLNSTLGLRQADFQILDDTAVTFSWYDPAFLGKSLNDNDTLFVIRYELLGNNGDTAFVKLTNDPTIIEFTNPNFEEIPVSSNVGLIIIKNNVLLSVIVEKPDESKIAKANVYVLSFQGDTLQQAITDASGKVTFELDMNQDYSVSVEKNINLLNGVTTLDRFWLKKQILTGTFLTSHYQLVAGDVFKSYSLTALDDAFLQRLILHNIDELPNNKSWVFIDSKYEFSQPISNHIEYREAIELQNLVNDTAVKLIGIKVGDLNMNSNPLNKGNVALYYSNYENNIYTLKFAGNKAVGFEFVLQADDLSIVSSEVMNSEDYNIKENRLYVSYLNEDLNPEIFTEILKLKSNNDLNFISGNIIFADGSISNLEFIPETTTSLSNEVEVLLYPNPANNYIIISGLNNGVVKIYDISGRKLKEDNINGKTRIDISGLSKGLYTVLISNEHLVRKFVLVKY